MDNFSLIMNVLKYNLLHSHCISSNVLFILIFNKLNWELPIEKDSPVTSYYQVLVVTHMISPAVSKENIQSMYLPEINYPPFISIIREEFLSFLNRYTPCPEMRNCFVNTIKREWTIFWSKVILNELLEQRADHMMLLFAFQELFQGLLKAGKSPVNSQFYLNDFCLDCVISLCQYLQTLFRRQKSQWFFAFPSNFGRNILRLSKKKKRIKTKVGKGFWQFE